MNQEEKLPFISVVIATHNRRDMLIRVINALFCQDYPPDRLEVIAVLDGCIDDTEEALQTLDPPCQFRYAKQPQSGQAAARNKGIKLALGEVIVFVDDDVEPAPGFLRAHAAPHAKADNLVVQGYTPFSEDVVRNLHMSSAALWWDRHFEHLSKLGSRLGHTDLCSGNMSVRRQHLLAAGGFDEEFMGYGDEDYELGTRLTARGLQFQFCREALAWHHFSSNLAKSLRRVREEARADVIYGRKYPHLKTAFRLYSLTQNCSTRRNLLRILAFNLPLLGDLLAAVLLKLMEVYEAFGLRERWAQINVTLCRYHYFRGLKDSLGSYGELLTYLGGYQAEQPAEWRTKVLSVDLRRGMPEIEGWQGYRALHILLKDGKKPLAWLWYVVHGGVNRREVQAAVMRQALVGLVNGKQEDMRLARVVLPFLFDDRRRRPVRQRRIKGSHELASRRAA